MLFAATIAFAGFAGLLQGGDAQAPATKDVVLTTYKMAGQSVEAKIPPATANALPGVSSLEWNGWTYLFGDKGGILGRAKAGGGWADVKALYDEAKSKIGESTPQWKLKAFILTRVDVIDRSKSGVCRQRRSTLEPSMVTRALESLARFCAMAEAYGGGRFKIVPDVTVENDTFHGEPGKPTFDDAFAQWYFGPRINGGEFDAEDKIYRGPYDSVLFIHPGLPGDGQPTSIVNGMPVTGIAYEPNDDGQPARDLAVEEFAVWLGQMARAAGKWEVPSGAALSPEGVGEGAYTDSPESLLVGSMWSEVGGTAPPPLDRRLAILARQGKPVKTDWTDAVDDPWRKLPWLKPADVATYAGKTELLDLGKPGVSHDFEFAKPADGAATPEPPDVALDSRITLGKESLALLPYGERSLLFVPGSLAAFVAAHFKADLDAKAIGAIVWGTDRFVVFDVASSASAKSELELLDLSSTPPVSHAPGAPTFDGVRCTLPYAPAVSFETAANLTADPVSDNVDARNLAAAQLSDDSPAAQKAAVVALLGAREESVRLNAAMAFCRVHEPTAEAGLTQMTFDYNTRLAGVALRALAFQNSDTAWATVQRVMKYGRYDYSRQVACELMGTRNDPKLSPVISVMLTARSWQARLAGAEAVGKQKDLGSQRILMAFLNEVDPGVRLGVTRSADTQLDPIAHELLWPAVNDPSDQVRAWSYIGLIRSPKDENRTEGYKGVRDDSIAVRLMMLRELRDHPAPEHRGAIRIAVADASALVRATALEALAKQPGDVTLEEIANVTADKDPRVQTALIGLAKAKSLKLSADTVAMLRASVDPSVAAAAKEIPD